MSKGPNYQEIAERLAQENAALTEALQRERADAINVRRRAETERERSATLHKAHVVKEMLPIIDNFERALQHIPKDLEKNDFIKGINGLVKQFDQTLKKLGVQRIKTVGDAFDPQLHEAVSVEEGGGKKEIVSEELQSGWHINGEVIRHAIVRVKS